MFSSSFPESESKINANVIIPANQQLGHHISHLTHINKHLLRSNAASYSCKPHYTESQDTVIGRKLCYLPLTFLRPIQEPLGMPS